MLQQLFFQQESSFSIEKTIMRQDTHLFNIIMCIFFMHTEKGEGL